MEKVQEIYCLKASKKLFGLTNPAGDSIVFIFQKEESANKFVEHLATYAPEFSLVYLPCGTIKELRAFLLKNPMFLHVEPVVEISFPKEDFSEVPDSFLVRLKESLSSK